MRFLRLILAALFFMNTQPLIYADPLEPAPVETMEEISWEDSDAEVPSEEESETIPSGSLPMDETLTEVTLTDETLSDPEPEPAPLQNLETEEPPIPPAMPSPSPSGSPSPLMTCSGSNTVADPKVCTTIWQGSKTVVTSWDETTYATDNGIAYTQHKTGTITEEYTENEDGSYRLASKGGSKNESYEGVGTTPDGIHKEGKNVYDYQLIWEVGELGEIISESAPYTLHNQWKYMKTFGGTQVLILDQDQLSSSFDETGYPTSSTGHKHSWIYDDITGILMTIQKIEYSDTTKSIYTEENNDEDVPLDIWTIDNDGDGTIDDWGYYGDNIA